MTLFIAIVFTMTGCGSTQDSTATNFIFTSDAHYGITQTSFQGASNVDAHTVNAAMVSVMNTVPSLTLPCNDNGVLSCKQVGWINYVAETGDIGNRMEALATTPVTYIQSSEASLNQFTADYINSLSLKAADGSKSALFMVPGNHDVSNAIGYYKTMSPVKDATTIAQIYNLMMNPATPKTKDTYNYSTDKVFYSRDIGGVHFVFISMWPDTAARTWMENDLKRVSSTTPVIIFTHDQPDIETKHLTNPNGAKDINATDKFENCVADVSTDRDISGNLTINAPSTTAQRGLVSFLKAHKNIVAYFHGNDHINGMYTYTGPDNDISLNVIRVDSPMKGTVSATDPNQLIFKVVSIDPAAQNMTVRDYLWYTKTWGASTTFSLAPRTK